MADFHPILARAIAGLTDKSPEARRAVYDRARAALLAQLRSLDPPLSEADITRERLSLDEAVSRIEAEIALAEAIEPSFPPQPSGERRSAEPTPPARPESPAERPAPPAPAADNARFDEPPLREDTAPIRPRVAPPRGRSVNPGHVRTAVVGVGVALAVAVIAGAAYYVNKISPQPEQAARPRPEAPAQPAQPEHSGKISERAGTPETPASQPGNARSAPGTPGQTSDIAVAQRAVLYIEVPEAPQQPRTVPGRVFWRLDSDTVGQGQPVETIVRATVEVPDAGLALDFTIRRNTDQAFPASHIIGMRFTTTGEAASDAIREVGVPQFKTDESERGAPLSAIASALGENLFVAALSNVQIESDRNLDLLQSRSWIDLPVRFASGRRGIITFEKGVSGNQTIADALARWRG
ncbi:histidine kinase [Bosea rubneri]|uniref:Histidine kinase n=1 Tax=Bosea rubneri TaxID=3075434 RepID=A0ABU3S9T3_9HYPH|nr:histidine kinase [Bosea sp. ZW T0_25]MDU0341509.1 histidine kinase [Bosea sp. ZW T0_25]